MRTLRTALTTFFGRGGTAQGSRRKSPRYRASDGVVSATIKRRLGLWTVTIGEQPYRNSRLGDLKQQLSELGFRVTKERSR